MAYIQDGTLYQYLFYTYSGCVILGVLSIILYWYGYASKQRHKENGTLILSKSLVLLAEIIMLRVGVESLRMNKFEILDVHWEKLLQCGYMFTVGLDMICHVNMPLCVMRTANKTGCMVFIKLSPECIIHCTDLHCAYTFTMSSIYFVSHRFLPYLTRL